MAPMQTTTSQMPSGGEPTSEYLFDMIAQLAELARRTGETQAAIFLEAILAARRTRLEERSP